MEYDSSRNRLNLVYAKWRDPSGTQKNNFMLRTKVSASGTWSAPTLVAGDGANDYWIPSLLTIAEWNYARVLHDEWSRGRRRGWQRPNQAS